MTEKERLSRCASARRARARERGEEAPLMRSGPKATPINPGDVFGEIEVMDWHSEPHQAEYFKCHCNCGCNTERVVMGSDLRSGRVTSCRRRSMSEEEKTKRLTQPRWCRMCEKTLPTSDFRWYKGLICKSCERRASGIRSYGLTLEEHAEMLRRQNNKCAVCHGPPRDGWVLEIDHDHRTGKNRDLLCSNCNSALGYIDDSIEVAKSLIKYLIKHGNNLTSTT